MRNLFNIYRDKNKNITLNFKKNFKANLIITDEELNECSLPGRIRVNGDQKDHISIKEGIFISSMDIRIEDNLNSYNDFKLLLPETRRYKSEIFISTLFSELNFLSPYASLIKIDYFKKKQNYLFYENLGKEFLERNNRIEGPIIRGDERFYFDNNEKFDQIVVGRLENSNWIKNNEKNQVHISIEALTKANQIFLERYFVKSKKPPNMLIFNDNKINQFIQGRPSINQAFTQGITPELRTNFRVAPNVRLRYSYSVTDNTQGNRKTKFIVKSPNIEFDAYIREKVTFVTDYSFTRQEVGNDQQSFQNWNAGVTYRDNKDSKWEFELKATNILNIDAQVRNSSNSFSVLNSQTFIQPRFITFRAVYNL